MIPHLRRTYLARLSPAAFAWAFAGYMALWFVVPFVLYMWRMWPKLRTRLK